MTSRRRVLAAMGSLFCAPGREKLGVIPLQMILLKSRSEAQEAARRLESCESFEALAGQLSLAPNANAGGHLGNVELAALRPPFREILRGLKPGHVSQIIRTDAGYAIFKVAEDSMPPASQATRQSSMGGEGIALSYSPVTAVDGLYETQRLFDQLPKPQDYQQHLRTNCSLRSQEPTGGIQEIASYVFEANHVWGQLLSYQGDMAQAIERFKAARDIAAERGLTSEQAELEKKIAIAYFHQAEAENWVVHHTPESSIFPISPRAQFKLQSDCDQAIEHLLQCLKRNPQALEEKWLLNLACMAAGHYPERVPDQHRIALAPFQSKLDIGKFIDIAPALSLDRFGMAGGVIIDDFDNNGFLDIVVSTWDTCQSLRYFHNNGDGTFTDRTGPAKLSEQLGGLNIFQTDYNNDGLLDIFVARGGWQNAVRCSLLRNNGDGTFTDVTREAGLAVRPTATQAVAWFDFDNDGFLDLFLGNEYSPSQLFHNNGNGTFTDVAHAAGVDRVAFSKAVAAGDYDGDGYPDIYVSNYSGENFLYHNNGNGTFVEVARQLGVEKPIFSFPTWFFDYDNDGWLDLFVSSFVHSVEEVIGSYLGIPGKAETLKLYKNRGGKAFQDVTHEAGLDRVTMPMGSNFGDIDNDGFLDIYLGTGDPSYASMVPNILFKNVDGKYFTDVTASSGTGSLQKGHGVAFADIFNDGQTCLFEVLGGATPADAYYCSLFQNSGIANNWINVKLVGVKTNRAAIGARIKLTVAGSDEKLRWIYRHVNSGGSFGASPLAQHIGLGKASRIEEMEVWWPTSKTRQIFRSIAANQFLLVREFSKTYSKLDRKKIKLHSLPSP